MTPKRHALIRDLFLEVVSKPDGQRRSFLNQRCGRDARLRGEVEKLLAHHDERTVAPPAPADGATGPSETPAPGVLVARRYRIISMLGQGGMGQVYRADDLALDQPVAIKFLDPRFAGRPAWLARFRNEVRLARLVTHPNVCRVFDISGPEEAPFLSMEYVEGEDLSKWLRRENRPDTRQVVEVARQICGGLAAAHGAGVLHRDLKPQNILFDRTGKVRLTDFGVAAAFEDDWLRNVPSGTPAYMAPEQFAGRNVDVRSDLYSLGIVLYELFAGRPPFEAETVQEYRGLHEHQDPVPLSEAVPGIDPDLAGMVHHCLRKNPRERPSSALAVAAALPGIDVLAVAQEANLTPPPALVVGAQDDPLRVRRPALPAWFVLVTCALLPFARSGMDLPWERPHALAPGELAQKAREALAGAGFPVADLGFADGFCDAEDAAAWLQPMAPPPWQRRPPAIPRDSLVYWQRVSSKPLAPQFAETLIFDDARVSLLDPSFHVRGEAAAIMSLEGRLLAVATHSSLANDASEVFAQGWSACLSAAALTLAEDPSKSSAAQTSNSRDCQSRLARDGRGDPVEAVACWRESGASFFAVLSTADDSPDVDFQAAAVRRSVIKGVMRLMFIIATVLALPWAWRNYQTGRCDLVGAVRLGGLTFVSGLVIWLFGSSHVRSLEGELTLLTLACFRSIGYAAIVVVLYLVLEPAARRNWPQPLISWIRLLHAQWRDSLVGGHILVGLAFGCFWVWLAVGERYLVDAMGATPRTPLNLPLAANLLFGGGRACAGLLGTLLRALAEGILFSVLLSLARQLTGSPRRAAWIVMVFLLPVVLPRGAHAATAWLVWGLGGCAAAVWLTMRFGLLALVVAMAVAATLNAAPLRVAPPARYAVQTVLVLSLVALPALYALVRLHRGPRKAW
jgi:serine/threonine-protein kinase